jgi:hypothetical protein
MSEGQATALIVLLACCATPILLLIPCGLVYEACQSIGRWRGRRKDRREAMERRHDWLQRQFDGMHKDVRVLLDDYRARSCAKTEKARR